MKRVRSYKTNAARLDDNLVSLQDQGYAVTQILPCPEAMDCKPQSHKSDAFSVNVSMNFMIIFIEDEEAE